MHYSNIQSALKTHLVGGFGCGFVFGGGAFYKFGTNYAEWKPFIIFIPLSVNISMFC